MRQGMLTLSGAPSTTSQFGYNTPSIWIITSCPICISWEVLCTLIFDLMRNLSGASKLASTYFTLFYRSVHVLYTGIFKACKYIYSILFSIIQNFNPAFDCTIDPKYKELFARKESAIPSFGITIQSLLDVSLKFPPWTMDHPKFV